jgi:hypothetical protein
MKRWLILLMLITSYVLAQNTPTIGVLPDNGPNLPATCVIGQIYFMTATTIGLNQCNPANVWTALATSAGSGTVSANNGVANAIATYAAAGGSTTVAPAANTACIPGATSGSSCFTAPAVAGTANNPIVITNAIGISTRGTVNLPAITFGGDTNSGIYSPAVGYTSFSNGGTQVAAIGPGGVEIISSTGLKLEQSGTSVLSSLGTGITSFDTSAGNGLGSSTNCRTVVNVTPVTVSANVTTDQNLMVFTLPANCLNVVGRTLRIFVAGVYSTAAASTAQMTLKVKICSVSGCGSGNVASVISIQSAALGTLTITNNAWNGTFYVTTQTAGATGAWEAHGALGIDEGALATAADSFFNDSNIATVTGSPSAIDTTAQNFLQVTFAFSAASASNSVTQRQLVIDSVN